MKTPNKTGEAQSIFIPLNSRDRANDPINQSAKPISGKFLTIGFKSKPPTPTSPKPKSGSNAK